MVKRTVDELSHKGERKGGSLGRSAIEETPERGSQGAQQKKGQYN